MKSFRKTLPSLILTAFAVSLAAAATPPETAPPAKPARVTSVEGITEYRLGNGLRVLLFPDPTKQTITVNITYLVGSRNENYGETGMAHLLEHLMFKGTPGHPNIPQELTAHGARLLPRLLRETTRAASVSPDASEIPGDGYRTPRRNFFASIAHA